MRTVRKESIATDGVRVESESFVQKKVASCDTYRVGTMEFCGIDLKISRLSQ